MSVVIRTNAAASILLTCLMALCVTCANENLSAPAGKRKLASAQLPFVFEVNRGQAAPDTKFVVRGGGYAMQLTDRGEAVLTLKGRTAKTVEQAELWLKFPGRNSAPEVEGEDRLPGHSNYLIGSDPQKWLTDVPHYARVRYRGVFSGVDVVYYAKEQRLEYDFIVSPDTDPDFIRMTAQGANGIEHSDLGSLSLKTAAGSVTLHKPVAYQQSADGEREVACSYVLDRGEIRFVLGDYDHGRELRIDPVLSYSARLDANLTAIAVDASGNSYLAGSTLSADFPTTGGAFQSTRAGAGDAVIAELNPTGSTLLFATYLGGSGNDSASSLTVDSSGNIVVSGWTSSANFPLNHGFQSILLGDRDAFVSKLNANGAELLYSTYLGGSGNDSAAGVALDGSGRVLVTGSTDSSNFPTSSGVLQQVLGGGTDAFIAKLDPTKSGTASLLFSTYLGGNNVDEPNGVAVDSAGAAFVTGMTHSTNFPVANAFQATCSSCSKTINPAFDAFVSKLSANGTALLYSTFLGGDSADLGGDIAVDGNGDAYVAGSTCSSNFPLTVGAFQTSFRGVCDAFVSKLNDSGSALLYSTLVGGDDFDRASGIALDGSGKAFITGYTQSSDFPTVNPIQGNSGGTCEPNGFGLESCPDAIVSQLDTSGSRLIFSTYLGGAGTGQGGSGLTGSDSGSRIALDPANNIYIAGSTSSTDFPITPGALRMSGTGFVVKVSASTSGTKPTSTTVTSSPNPSGQGESATFTATVAPAGATGMVTFRDVNTVIGSSSLNASGIATIGSNSLQGGSHSIIAEYSGDANFAASGSAVFTHVVTGISVVSGQTSATVSKGQSATFPLTVSQSGSLNSAISFSCSGLPAGWSCGFSPMTVEAGSGPTQVTLTVQTATATAQSLPWAVIESPRWPTNFWVVALALLMLVLLNSLGRAKQAYVRVVTALGFAILLVLATGCGAGSSADGTQPPITANFTVNATSDSTASSTSLTITAR